MSDQARSRRDFLRQAGTVAWATPFILTMAAPSAHAQASCLPAGVGCGNWNSALQICLPLSPPRVCCDGGTCEHLNEDDTFCTCVA